MSQSLKPVVFPDPPQVIDAAVTLIPKKSSPPLQIIAALAQTVYKVKTSDTIGKYIGIYSGPDSNLQLVCICGEGVPDRESVSLTKGTRISIRAMDDADIVLSQFQVQFLGEA